MPIKFCELLLQARAAPLVKDNMNRSAMQQARIAALVETESILLAHSTCSSCPHAASRCETLSQAVWMTNDTTQDHSDCVKFLLNLKADPDGTSLNEPTHDISGRNSIKQFLFSHNYICPLFDATNGGSTKIVQLLCSAKAGMFP